MRTQPGSPGPTRAWSYAMALCLLLALAGCGFQLRGSATLPFDTLYVDMVDTSLALELKRNLRTGSNAKLVERREDAQALLTRTTLSTSKQILSINSAGRVREFRLRYLFGYALVDQKGQDLAPPASVSIERTFSFNDNQVLAKENEEAVLYRDMQSDLVQQVIRRLAATPATPPAPANPDK